ncbi:unnamed protein product [Caenorhabditis angaria]|uniref:Uncharacterized protein n=1 Tax=Caenorhabditis angaria TaxID=860376 RepID=A0A9P1IIS6_9PELO|nr:unnamed protein product [Caenorhabditis angaria]
MPLEVTASLDRDVAIYLAGETLRVTVTIQNVTNRGKISQTEQLAWGSVQFICERTIGASTKWPSNRPRPPTTSMVRPASTVYSSQPNIIFCELKLAPNQSKQFTCDIPLSRNSIPPTFRGTLVKYSNRVTVAVSHVQAHIRIANLPVRIIPSVGLEAKLSIPENPFLASTMTKPTVIETVMATVDDLTMSRKSLAYSLVHSSSRVALLTLPKKAYKLGDDVCGYLDFKDSKTPCVQYSASIETEEKMIDPDVEENEETEHKRKITKTHSLISPITVFTEDSTFRLNIPLGAAPTFSTDSVQLKWKIRFVFVVSSQEYAVHVKDNIVHSNAPTEVPVESFSWSTEILVLPCKPQNAALLDTTFPNTVSLSV